MSSVKTNVEPNVYKGPRKDPSSIWSSPPILTDADPSNNTGPPSIRTATQHKEWDAPAKPKVNILSDNDWIPTLPS